MRNDKNFHYTISATGIKRNGDLESAHIHSLKQARVDIRVGHNAIVGAASEGDRKLTDVENQTLDKMVAEMANVEQHLVLAEREQEIERGSWPAAAAAAGTLAPRGRKFTEMFPSVALDMGGFQSANEFLGTMHAGLSDPRLMPTYTPRGMMATATGTVDSDGGYSVPTQMFQTWIDSSLESEIVRSRADVRGMTSSDAVAPGWDDGDHSSTLYGGFTGQWVTEGSDITPTTPKMRLIHLHARKLAILTSVSNELLADGQNFDQQLGVAITKALGWFLDTAFLSGAGAAAPLGVINSPCTITIAKETNQTAATINYTNICKMLARLAPASFTNAIWVCNSTALVQLLQMSHPIGVGGVPVPVLTESAGKFRLLTLPLILTEKLPSLGTKGDICLLDFSQYCVGIRADFSLAKSAHVDFGSDKTMYRGLIRVDGQSKLSAPITPKYGDTVSPFVTLADRG